MDGHAKNALYRAWMWANGGITGGRPDLNTLLAWAATQPDSALLNVGGLGSKSLQAIRETAPLVTLDAAWAEAEAALPRDWQFELQRLDFDGPWNAFAKSRAFWEDDYTVPGRDDQYADGDGDTPAAALRALAAKLRER